MKKFTKILENLSEQKFFEITAEVKLLVKSENEGEAGYIADSILGGIEEQSDFTIQNISEISEEEYKKFESYGIGLTNKSENENTDEQKILKTWEAEFGNRTPTISEKMEFYHNMRLAGLDGILIMNALKDKISETWLKNQSQK